VRLKVGGNDPPVRKGPGVCEYCGCQELAAIATLTAEHDVVVNLSGAACRALTDGALDLAAERARAIAAVLAPHSVVEEEALFPAMAEELGDHLPALVEEHRMVERVLAESAERTPTDPTWPARLEHTLDVLRDHILKEQDGVFPAALIALDPVQWDHLEAVRARVESGIGTDAAMA
jgi:hemerythrin-like domain-containing protein